MRQSRPFSTIFSNPARSSSANSSTSSFISINTHFRNRRHHITEQLPGKRILTRNISLPLGVGALSAAVFVALIFYLLSALGGVEQTERAISNANQIGKLGADMETMHVWLPGHRRGIPAAAL